MATKQHTYIEDDLDTLVGRVSTSITAKLQETEPTITGVHFRFGTLMELQETLIQLGKSNTGVVEKFPMVFMFVDFDEPVGFVGDYANLSIRIAILHHTSRVYKAKERLDNNFKPIIMPIYHELLRQITLAGDMFLGASAVENIVHTATRRYYWGRESENGNTENKLLDPVDGLDIRNLQLKHYLTRCF